MTIARAALPALMALVAASPAAARPGEDTRVFAHASPLLQWRASVSHDISDNLVLPRSSVTSAPEGVVKVAFVADAAGKADSAQVVQSSGSPELDRAALFAISRLRTLGDAPAGVSERPLQAWIVFANTDAAYDRYTTALRREAFDATAGGDAPLIATMR